MKNKFKNAIQYLLLIAFFLGSGSYRSAQAQIINGGFESSESELTGWSHNGASVSTGETILSWTVNPADSRMAHIVPYSYYAPTAEAALNLSPGSLSFSGVTNFGILYQDISLLADQTITIWWNYVSEDYSPYDDGSFASFSTTGSQEVKILARTVSSGLVPATGSYGSSGWHTVTFTAPSANIYRLGLGCFNYGDQSVSPHLFVDNGEGGTMAPGDPVISTNPVTDITGTSVTGGGNISSAGNGATSITVRGVCWSTDPSPTILDEHTDDGTGIGGFTSLITGLTPGTTYYLRAYAINDLGKTAYGGVVTFETLSNSGPVAVCRDLFLSPNADGIVIITPDMIDNGSYSECGEVTLSLSEDTLVFDCANIGENTVMLTVTDECENMSQCTATITIADNSKPVALCKDTIVYLDMNGEASIDQSYINNGSYDNCDLRFPLVDKKYFDCSNLGENTVTLTVNDFSGNFDYCAATVTIADSILPVISDLQDITVIAEANACTAVVEFEAPTATDNCSVTVEQTAGPVSGSEFPAGSTLVTFVATDAAGNTTESSFTVTVEGVNVAPVIAPVADVVVQAFATSVDVPLTGIGFGSDCLDQLVNSVTASASNTSLINSASVAYVEGETTAVLTLSMPGGLSGTSEITVTVTDNGGTANGGFDTAETTFMLTALENHAPETTIELDTIFIDKNTTLVKSLPAGLFSDPDAGDVLGYVLETLGGTALPAWISLNEATMEVSLSPTATEVGEHKFVLTATDLLGASISAEVVVVVQIPTGIAEFEDAFGLHLYPNPSKGKVQVSVENSSLGQIEISVHTMAGQEIHRKAYGLSAPVVLDLSGQPDGIYLIKLKSEMNEITKKVILKK